MQEIEELRYCDNGQLDLGELMTRKMFVRRQVSSVPNLNLYVQRTVQFSSTKGLQVVTVDQAAA